MGNSEKSGRQSKRTLTTVATLATVAALGCTAQISYAANGNEATSAPFLNPVQMDRSILRLNEAWSEVKNAKTLRSFLKETRNALKATKRIATQKLETIKFQHYYNGLEVVGSMVMQQNSNSGNQVLNHVAELDLDTNPRLNDNEAVGVALSLLGKRDISSKPTLKILPDSEGSGAHLVYWIDVDADEVDGAREVVVDAVTGDVIGNISKNIEIAPITVYSAARQGTLIAEVVSNNPLTGKPEVTGCTLTNMSNNQTTKISADKCKNLKMSDLPPNQCQVVIGDRPMVVQPNFCQAQVMVSQPVGSDAAARRAFQNSQAVLAYYQTHHNRNSYDGKGSTPVNVVHAGIGFDNAYWSTAQNIMVYGDGDGKTFGDFTTALDVAGHEQTHGVVAYTAKLLGMRESGALNEAFADFFGKMIANDNDWAIGRKLFKNPAQAKGVRDLANPGNLTFCATVGADGRCAQRRPFPSTIAQKMPQSATCDGSNDNCWVHINSTIQGHASYLVVQAIGAQKAEQLYYAALTHVLTAKDDLTTAARSIKGLCPKVLDAASCTAVTQAYAKVGL